MATHGRKPTAARSKARRSTNRRDLPAREAFLKAYEACGIITVAADAAKVSRQAVYDWLEHEPEFKAKAQLALRAWAGSIEEIIVKIAKGRKPQRFAAAVKLLEVRGPDEWRPKQRIEHTGANGGPIRTASQPITKAERAEVEAMLEQLGVSRNGKHALEPAGRAGVGGPT